MRIATCCWLHINLTWIFTSPGFGGIGVGRKLDYISASFWSPAPVSGVDKFHQFFSAAHSGIVTPAPMSLWTLMDPTAHSLEPQQGHQHRKRRDSSIASKNHVLRATGSEQMPQAQNTVLGNTPRIKLARTTRNPTKLNKAKDEGGGQNGQKATGILAPLGSDYSMIGAPLGSGLACSGEAKIFMVSEVLRKAAEQAKGSGIFLDLFSGRRAPVTRALKQQGQVCVPFDTLLGLEYDLCSAGVLNLLLAWIESSKVAGLSLALPCGSWSSARHGIPGGTCPPALRDRSSGNIYGFKNLSPRDTLRVNIGNATMRSGAAIINKARLHQIPTVMENGILSMIWYAPEIRSQLFAAVLHTCDYCQHGTPWRKRTRFAAWHTGARSKVLMRLCSSKHGVCDRTGKPHIRLRGWVRGFAQTRTAEEYPKGIAKGIAELLPHSNAPGLPA